MSRNLLKGFKGIIILTASILVAQIIAAAPGLAASTALGKVAYIQNGDVWVKVLPDGEAHRLTTDGRNSHPRWSPSGEWLAFRKWKVRGPDRMISPMTTWVMRADGSGSRALSHEGWTADCVWAPKSDRMACTSTKLKKPEEMVERETLLVNADGSDPVDLKELNANHGDIVWSPDGETIAFTFFPWILADARWKELSPADKGGLRKISARGGKISHLPVPVPAIPPQGRDMFRPNFPMPAGWVGSYIIYWQGDEAPIVRLRGEPLYAVPADGGKPRRLTEDKMFVVFGDFFAPSPDGRFLAIVEAGSRETWTNRRIVLLELASGKRTVLTEKKSVSFSPAWSPDGQRLAYVSAPDMGATNDSNYLTAEDEHVASRRIWIMNRDGSGKRKLTTDPYCHRPQWSADGRHILFARISKPDKLNRAYQAILWLVNAEGGKPVRVVDELPPNYYWDDDFDWWKGSAH